MADIGFFFNPFRWKTLRAKLLALAAFPIVLLLVFVISIIIRTLYLNMRDDNRRYFRAEAAPPNSRKVT